MMFRRERLFKRERLFPLHLLRSHTRNMRESRWLRILHVPAAAGEAVKKAATALFDLEAHSNVNRACSLCGGGRGDALTKFASDIAIHHCCRPQPQFDESFWKTFSLQEFLLSRRPNRRKSAKFGNYVRTLCKITCESPCFTRAITRCAATAAGAFCGRSFAGEREQ